MVEDDDGHAILLCRELQKIGIRYPITRFRDGQEVIDFFEGSHPAESPVAGARYLMLLDMRMPKVDGIGVLEFLQKGEALRLLPVIVLTTASRASEVERCHQVGCNAYVVKPVKFEHFVETVRRLGDFIRTVEIPQLSLAPATS